MVAVSAQRSVYIPAAFRTDILSSLNAICVFHNLVGALILRPWSGRYLIHLMLGDLCIIGLGRVAVMGRPESLGPWGSGEWRMHSDLATLLLKCQGQRPATISGESQ